MASTNSQGKTTTIPSPKKQSQSTYNTKKKYKNEVPLEESEEEDDNNDDYWFSDSTTSDNEDEREPRLIMYAAYTQYDVVKEVAKNIFNFHLTKNDQKEFDIAWFDGPISIKLLQRMWPHQRTNHFPGMYNLARKNCLGKHLMRMQKWFPSDYDFFPQTFMLPVDYKEFKAQITAKRNKTFIVKPEASCQGKGIFLTRNFEDCNSQEHYVVQRYMHKPFLVDGYKFDLRLYVMLAGVNPLRIYLYKEGLARFATVLYESPQPSNLANLFMHLTNYAINKESENFISNTNEDDDDRGSKRSFTSILRRITQEFGEDKTLEVMDDIKDIVIKTLCIAQPHLQHLYRSSQPDDLENQMCFQILGFDIILDHHLKPQLLEVNQSPSFTTDSPLDYKIKKALITDTIRILNLSIKRKLKVKSNKRAEMQKRLFKSFAPAQVTQGDSTGISTQIQKKTTSPLPKTAANTQNQQQQVNQEKQAIPKSKIKQAQQVNREKLSEKIKLTKIQKKDEKEEQRKKKMLQREKHERELYGNYSLIYPLVSYEEEFKILEQEKQQQQQFKTSSPKKGTENQTQNQSEQFQIQSEITVAQCEIQQTDISNIPWQQQQKYFNYMEKAKELWETFTNGNASKKHKQREQLQKQEEEEKERRNKQKQKLLERMRRQQEERKQEELRIITQRQANGLDQEGNLFENGDYLEQYEKSNGTLSARIRNTTNLYKIYTNTQDQVLSPTHAIQLQRYQDFEGQKNAEFYLPKVERKIPQYQQRRQQSNFSYDYNTGQNLVESNNVQVVPAVPPLSKHFELLMSDSPTNKRKINLVKNDSWNKLQKPPINKSQLFQLKNEEIESNQLLLQRINMQNQVNQYQEQIRGNKPPLTQINSKMTNKNVRILPSAHNHQIPQKVNNPNEEKIGGLSNYSLNNLIIGLSKRSSSQDRREVRRQIQKQSQLPLTTNPAPMTFSMSQPKKIHKMKSQNDQSSKEVVSLGIIGEKKQLQDIDYKQIQSQLVNFPASKPQRILRIKDNSMHIEGKTLFRNHYLHSSSSQKQI